MKGMVVNKGCPSEMEGRSKHWEVRSDMEGYGQRWKDKVRNCSVQSEIEEHGQKCRGRGRDGRAR